MVILGTLSWFAESALTERDCTYLLSEPMIMAVNKQMKMMHWKLI